MNDREQLCKEFTELTGGHWHELIKKTEYRENTPYILCSSKCSCGLQDDSIDRIMNHVNETNPTYINPADVIIVMMNRPDFYMFLDAVGGKQTLVFLSYIIEPDAMLKAAVRFLKGKS